MLKTWNKPKHSTACLFHSQLLLAIVLLLITWQLSFAKAPKQLSVPMDQSGGSCPQSIALYDGLRLTLQFPSKVRVAVPSHDQMIDIFISGRLIVINPSSKRRVDRNQVTLTTELSSHQAFICKFELFTQSQLREQGKPVELIRIQSRQTQEILEIEALNLLGAYLEDNLTQKTGARLGSESRKPRNQKPNAAKKTWSPRSLKLLESWQKRVAQHSIHKLLVAPDFQVSSQPPLRAQDHLIYVVIERIIRSQQRLFLRIKLYNRSQAVFELDRVYYDSSTQLIPQHLWSIDSQKQAIKSLRIKAGGQAQYLTLTAPLDLLRATLSFASLDERVVKVDMTSFSEF